MSDMVGLDGYVSTKKSLVGVDWLNLTSQGLKAAGGIAESQQKKPGEIVKTDAEKAADAKKAADAAAAASKRKWYWIGGLVVVVGGGYWLLRRKKHR